MSVREKIYPDIQAREDERAEDPPPIYQEVAKADRIDQIEAENRKMRKELDDLTYLKQANTEDGTGVGRIKVFRKKDFCY